ncbi:hypothetical protein L207DRAFT_243078 [Hyaloscypha variabilis F]|uniref:Uncharacterized protein n=1 Tax=Hyaloscypha variabilis (strain UAMH 11265 / GT02V1 / F) TaxID=1149755 RepID=A0A2J6S2D1_HYAVF|nr:hypothetical protein L207DRAFT_243078 [Hyaloscypha variabilis F]
MLVVRNPIVSSPDPEPNPRPRTCLLRAGCRQISQALAPIPSHLTLLPNPNRLARCRSSALICSFTFQLPTSRPPHHESACQPGQPFLRVTTVSLLLHDLTIVTPSSSSIFRVLRAT